MSKRPWMPLYIADFHADTGHLNAAETGAYLLLIMHYWQKGKLPPDESQLARIARLSTRDWKRYRATLKAFFRGQWKHKRIDKELAQAVEISNKRSASAKEMHKKKAANAEQVHTHSQLHSQSQEGKKEDAADAAPTGGPRRSRKKQRSSFPEGFDLSEERRAIALKAGVGSARVAEVFQHFKNHHVAKGSLFADWDAAWRTWCGNDKKFNTQPNGRRDAKPIGSFCDDLIASADFAESGGAHRNGDMRPADSGGEDEDSTWVLPERETSRP